MTAETQRKLHALDSAQRQAIRQRRQRSDDPQLNEIMDEIELRAEVEIAKLTRPVGS